ncbi:hypothetical protein MTR67_011979 [Solanum verrucosum]|uniref:Uncharacterized protein n=1 Tax=Solanum verrucosum TaxID=315347 RepID=A0AAF0TH34_SOLVR|nr:hypothetical protein MTR67_011979 [Solanum verrucosum]
MDRLSSIIEIADQLSDSPFGVVHRRLVLTFSIVVLGSLGDMVLLRRTARRCIDCSLFPLT